MSNNPPLDRVQSGQEIATAYRMPAKKVSDVPVAMPGHDIAATLTQRGSRYGVFEHHASITQRLKEDMRATPNWSKLSDDQKESLEMVAHKIGRILNGDPDYDDSWVDIAGYTKLVADRLQGVSR